MKEKYRAVLVGCGAMSGAWLSAATKHHAGAVDIVGLVDLRPEAAVARAKEFNLGSAWTGAALDEALRTLRPDIVFNCTIPEAHVATCSAALRAGCHVLMEKPLAPTVAEGGGLVRLAREAGRTLAIIQNRRYLGGPIAIRRFLEEGGLGTVHSVDVDFYVGPRFGGFRETMQHPLLLDMAIHTFDQCRQLLSRDAARVTCHSFNPPGSWFAHGASAVALFEMEGGACFSYRGSWCARGLPTSWQGEWRVRGERGSLTWDGEEKIVAERVAAPWDGKAFIEPVERLTIPVAPLEPKEVLHAGNMGDFLRAIATGSTPQTEAGDNLNSLAMVEGAIESSRTGASVTLSPTP